MVILSCSLRRLADEISVHEGTAMQPRKLIYIHALSCFPSFAIIISLSPYLFPSPPLHLSQGNVTFSCAEPIFVAMTFTSPQSFLWLPRVTEPSLMGMSVGLQFRTWNKAGLLLTFDLPNQEGAVWLYLSKATLHLQIHKPGRAPLELSTGQFEH